MNTEATLASAGSTQFSWQPIETAPIDGTRILFVNKMFDTVMIGRYRNGHIWTGAVTEQPSAIPREWADIASTWMPLPPKPGHKRTPPPSTHLGVTLEEYFERQIDWSRETFGPALRTGGVLDHIRKELREIEADPHDLSEWVDVVILAMDGFWRHGGKASDLLRALLAKQRKNMARTWPDWRTMSENSAIEHDRSHDVPTTEGSDDA